jgi:outer membrane lipoprotein-sorting protein
MFGTTFTALAVIFTLTQQAPALLAAAQMDMPTTSIPSEAELVDPATTRPDVAEVKEPTLKVTPPKAAPVVKQTTVPQPTQAPVTTTPEPKPTTLAQPVPQRQPAPIIIPVQATPETVLPTPSTQMLTGADRTPVLAKAKAALTAARTASGRFAQTNADGTQSGGTFALNRPGKMRFDYDARTPVLIVSDGTTVAIQDTELETIDRVPLISTPLGLLLNDNLEFGGDAEVIRVARNADQVGITVRDATGEVEGDLTMVFDRATYALQGWTTVDNALNTTTVELLDVTTNGRVDPRLFRLDEDEDEEDER